MRKVTAAEIQDFKKIYRANFGNSLSGYKSAALIGTRSEDGTENLALFNSIVHIGSSPPLLGFIQRPVTVPRHTYKNISQTGHYTINHITTAMSAQAHQTSAKYEEGVSEFDKTGLQPEYRDDHAPPFVAGSPLQLAMEFSQEYLISENATILMVGKVKAVYYDKSMQHNDGFLQLDRADLATINSLDGYAGARLKKRYGYARPDEETETLYDADR